MHGTDMAEEFARRLSCICALPGNKRHAIAYQRRDIRQRANDVALRLIFLAPQRGAQVRFGDAAQD